jgi:EAL domain-containing protein (putative c-di-GMP-specific phosphodiesterase class I)
MAVTEEHVRAALRDVDDPEYPISIVDMGLVRGVEKDPVRQALIAGLVHFADDTGSRLIAEGIETEAEASVMRRLHVSIGQGYLFGRPRPSNLIERERTGVEV